MLISLIDDSYQHFGLNNPATALVIPVASYYSKNVAVGSFPKNTIDYDLNNMCGSTGWFVKRVIMPAWKADPPTNLTFMSAFTGGFGGMRHLKSMTYRSEFTSNIYGITTHQLPGTSGHGIGINDTKAVDLIYRHVSTIMLEFYRMSNTQRPKTLSIGPLFWDPMYTLDNIGRDNAIELMVDAFSKYNFDMDIDIYRGL